MNKGYKRLKTEALMALLFAGFIAVGFFFLMNLAGDFLMDKYFQTSDYLEQTNVKCLNKFDKYVSQKKIATTDSAKIKEWVQTQKTGYVAIAIRKNGKNLFNSLNDDWEEDTSGYYQTGANRTISFADMNAKVYLTGCFDYQFYVKAMIGEVFLSVLLFLGIFIRFIQKKIDYVMKLEKEIKILETGGLDYEITIRGKDELASLAYGLNQMRITLRDNMKKEEAAVQANYNLVVSMAHDLRTPLTALHLYLDLLHKGQYFEKDQLSDYVEKSRAKATQIKRISDQLFERFLLSTEENIPPEPIQKAQYFFEDMLSDMTGYLTEQQFLVETDLHWPEVHVSLVMDYVGRIFDNISSNMIKYADIEKPIRIEVLQQKEWLVLKFVNTIANDKGRMDSTSVGIHNIYTMMEKMDGSCKTNQTLHTYELELRFKIVDVYHQKVS